MKNTIEIEYNVDYLVIGGENDGEYFDDLEDLIEAIKNNLEEIEQITRSVWIKSISGEKFKYDIVVLENPENIEEIKNKFE